MTLDKITENLRAADTTGEVESLEKAQKLSKEFRQKISTSKSLSEAHQTVLTNILTSFTRYYDNAYRISEELMDSSADFESLGDRSKKMATDLLILQKQLNSFQSAQSQAFDGALAMVIVPSEEGKHVSLLRLVEATGNINYG
ncbi:MAG: hypothetical protein HRU25_15820 [Psychrobium sp.]|nr:hypothetical protein [Psychrobium sp.]